MDVGGEFDPERLRFDHHQRGFDRTLDKLGSSIKLSSAGLVYEHFGDQVLKSLAKKNQLNLTDEDMDILYGKVYVFFVQEIDAIDNGVQMFGNDDKSSSGGDGPKPRYKIGTHVSARVGRLNPAWNAPEEARSRDAINRAFEKVTSAADIYIYILYGGHTTSRLMVSCCLSAFPSLAIKLGSPCHLQGSMLVGGELEETFLSLATEWLPARQIVASVSVCVYARASCVHIRCLPVFSPGVQGAIRSRLLGADPPAQDSMLLEGAFARYRE